MRATNILLLIIFGAIALAACVAYAGALDETRYVSTPIRNADGSIKRRADVLRAFQKIHPCPSTGLTVGPCPGWSMDHSIPLSNMGCDCVSNITWLPNVLKSGKGYYPKDRWERKINAVPVQPVIMPISGVLIVQ